MMTEWELTKMPWSQNAMAKKQSQQCKPGWNRSLQSRSFAGCISYDPHEPYRDHSSDFGDEFVGHEYDGELAYVDKQIGKLLSKLTQLGCLNRTTIVVAGDHGEGLGEHQENSHGYLAYNSTMQVPLIIVDPQISRTGLRIDEPVSLVDLYPTVLNLFRLSSKQPTSGRILPTDSQPIAASERACYGETEAPYMEGGWSPLRTWTESRWKYIQTVQPELYDLIADPHELNNIITSNPDEVARMEQRLVEFESGLKLRRGKEAILTPAEEKALVSLGYTSGESPAKSGERPQRDIKDTILYADQLHSCMHRIDRGELVEAQTILEGIVKAVPDYAKAWGTLGICLAKQRKFDRAEECFRQALVSRCQPEFCPHRIRANSVIARPRSRQR